MGPFVRHHRTGRRPLRSKTAPPRTVGDPPPRPDRPKVQRLRGTGRTPAAPGPSPNRSPTLRDHHEYREAAEPGHVSSSRTRRSCRGRRRPARDRASACCARDQRRDARSRAGISSGCPYRVISPLCAMKTVGGTAAGRERVGGDPDCTRAIAPVQARGHAAREERNQLGGVSMPL